MIEYSKYNSNTGEITQYGTMQNELFELEESVVIGSYNNTEFYINNGIATLRPVLALSKTSIAADGIDTATATGLPIPFAVDIDGEEIEINDGVFDFCHTIPGTYTITPRTFPYQSKPIEVAVS